MAQPLYPRQPRKRAKRAKKLKLLFLLVLLVLAAATAAGFVYRANHSIIKNALGLRNLTLNTDLLETDGSFYSYSDSENGVIASAGIDVSTFQGEIDWQAVREAGAEFAIIRAAYRGYETGRLAVDEQFESNLRGASAAGLHVGVYLYSQALTEQEAEEEADFLLDLISGYAIDYPVVYDQEEYTAGLSRAAGLSGEQATKNALAFCKRIYEAGYLPMVYVNDNWASTMYDMKKISRYPVWYANYTMFPSLSTGFAMWQYSEAGTVSGINEPVDLNLFLLPAE